MTLNFDTLLNIFSFQQWIHYINARVSQKFCNILVKWGTIWWLQMHLLMMWRWWTTLDCEMPSSPDTLQVLLIGFYLYGLEYSFRIHCFWPIWLCLIIKVLATWAKFLQPSDYFNVINCAFTFFTTNVFGCFSHIMAQFKFMKHIFLI